MKRALMLATLATVFGDCRSLEAQEPAKPLPETRIVLRVSRRFVQRLVGVRFQRDEPINSNFGRISVSGEARVTGRFQVTLHESNTESDFDVLASGEVTTQLSAIRRPVVVQAHGTAPFSARRRFVHKGDLFVAEKLTLEVQNHFTLDQIGSFRGGLIGAVTRRVAGPSVHRNLADGDREGEDEIRVQLTEAMERELDKLVVALNEIQPLVFKAHELVIAELKLPREGVRSYRAATKDHLLFSVGKADRRIPTLPDLAKDNQAPVELWIAASKDAAKEDRRKFLLERWHLIVPLLRSQLERHSPELTKEIDEPLTRLLEDVRVHEVPGWHIVAFAPKINAPVARLP